MSRRMRTLVALITTLILATSMTVLSIKPAEADSCASPTTLSYYPGSVTGVRYGQVLVNVTACLSSPPQAWSVTEKSWTNGTGKAVGVNIESVVENGDIGSYYRFFNVRITLNSCLASKILLCRVGDSWVAKYYLSNIENKMYFYEYPISVDPTRGFMLWR
jgi:hypothetical protein